MVMSWLIHIGMTISVIQSVGAYMMSIIYICMTISVGFIEQTCGVQPLSMISRSLALRVPRWMSPSARV